MCHGKPLKEKINTNGGLGGVGGEIVVPRPSASTSLTGQRQKGKKTNIFMTNFQK
jgi:hypothetical protein